MQILTVDIGTGTQDILLFDAKRGGENCQAGDAIADAADQGADSAGDSRTPAAFDHRRDHGRCAVVGGGRPSPRRAACPGDRHAARTLNDDLDRVGA